MRILFVSHERNKKGSSISMLSLVQILIKLYGWQVDILLPFYGLVERTLKEKEIPHQVLYYFSDYRKIGKQSKWKQIVRERANDIAVFRLKRRLKKKHYDYIISNSTAVDIGARAAIDLGVKHVYYVREYMEDNFIEYRNKDRMKRLFEASDKVIFISQEIMYRYIPLYAISNYKIIYNGVAAEDYFIKDHEILNESTIRLIQVGELCDGKGTKESIEYIADLKKHMSCHLTFVGHSAKKYLNDVRETIKKQHLENEITIIPYTKNIKNLLKKADVLLMNSCFEGFGRATAEGMLGGLLALGKNTGGTKEIIIDNQTGVLFNNREEFIEKMININQERLKYRQIATEGQRYVMEKFSTEKNAQNVIEYLKERER